LAAFIPKGIHAVPNPAMLFLRAGRKFPAPYFGAGGTATTTADRRDRLKVTVIHLYSDSI
jgi:hypothetical protein